MFYIQRLKCLIELFLRRLNTSWTTRSLIYQVTVLFVPITTFNLRKSFLTQPAKPRTFLINLLQTVNASDTSDHIMQNSLLCHVQHLLNCHLHSMEEDLGSSKIALLKLKLDLVVLKEAADVMALL